MSSEDPENPNTPVTAALCKAYRETIHTEIQGVKYVIVGSISLATAILALLQYAMRFG